ncbi:MAG TPA: hypothetical protein VJ233_01955 [Hyphomicrobiaceae bacterium]|nr:hypothetical protein [Hyphomicrobiaceae bacterium]
MSRKLVSADELHAKWMKDPKYRKAYDELEEVFRRASAQIDARVRTDYAKKPPSQRRLRAKPSR